MIIRTGPSSVLQEVRWCAPYGHLYAPNKFHNIWRRSKMGVLAKGFWAASCRSLKSRRHRISLELTSSWSSIVSCELSIGRSCRGIHLNVEGDRLRFFKTIYAGIWAQWCYRSLFESGDCRCANTSDLLSQSLDGHSCYAATFMRVHRMNSWGEPILVLRRWRRAGKALLWSQFQVLSLTRYSLRITKPAADDIEMNIDDDVNHLVLFQANAVYDFKYVTVHPNAWWNICLCCTDYSSNIRQRS